MKKKLLIVLYGVGNSGKTTVLKEIFSLLSQDDQRINVEAKSRFTRGNDISPTVISFEGVLVGIASAGDDVRTVQSNLDYLFNDCKCDIVFCATRSYRKGIEPINDFTEKNSSLILLPFYKIKYQSNEGMRNSQLAQEMLAIAKLRWNNVNQAYNDFRFN